MFKSKPPPLLPVLPFNISNTSTSSANIHSPEAFPEPVEGFCVFNLKSTPPPQMPVLPLVNSFNVPLRSLNQLALK